MNIKDAFNGFMGRINVPAEYSGKLMSYHMMKVDDFKIAKEYQRHISPSAIKMGGALDLNKLTPIVACKRPDGEYYVVDGQHRTLRVIHSDYTGEVPVVVYEHDEDASISDCMKIEAKLFYELNSLAKKPTKLDEVRAGIFNEDPKSMRVYHALLALNACADNVGSMHDDAVEVKVFSHFYILCNTDYKDQQHKLMAGWDLYQQLFPQETKTEINSYMLRACCLIEEFTHYLSNGRYRRFNQYMTEVWAQRSIQSIVRGHATTQSPQYILDDLINEYNDWKGCANYSIGHARRQSMAENNSRFLVPVE